MSGTLICCPTEAKLTRDTEVFGKMDPYVKVKVGHQSSKTKVHQDAGLTPKWNDKLIFHINDEKEIKLTVWDDDVSQNEEIGSAVIPMQSVIDAKSSNQWYVIQYKNKGSGQVFVHFEWKPDTTVYIQQLEEKLKHLEQEFASVKADLTNKLTQKDEELHKKTEQLNAFVKNIQGALDNVNQTH